MFCLRDLPKYETLLSHSVRYRHVAPAACEAFLVMLRVASDVLAAGEAYLAQHRLSQGRFTVLMLLNRQPERGICPSELAERAGVTRATMTGLLDGLEREGLISRTVHHSDRRMVTIRLTDKGVSFLDRMLPDYFAKVAKLMGGLSEQEQKTLVQLLQKVQAGTPAWHEHNGAQ